MTIHTGKRSASDLSSATGVGQSLEVQLDKLAHCDKILEEKKSAASGTHPRLEACLEYVPEGETLVVIHLNRHLRSTLHLCQIIDALVRKAINFQVIDQHIDTRDATGRLLFNMLGAIAQFETEIRAERQMDGIYKAKSRGIHFRAKPKLTAEQIAELRQRPQQGDLIRVLTQDYNLSKATVYRYLSGDQPFEHR